MEGPFSVIWGGSPVSGQARNRLQSLAVEAGEPLKKCRQNSSVCKPRGNLWVEDGRLGAIADAEVRWLGCTCREANY